MMRLPKWTAVAWLICGVAGPALAVVDVSGTPSGIAVAPFSTMLATDPETSLPDVASLLARALSSRSANRVVAPADLRHDARGISDPQARDIRRWATWNRVDRVVIGRATRQAAGGLDVAVELRSGHSGAAEAEYRLESERDADLPSVVDALAVLILADANDAVPPVSAAASGKQGEGADDSEREQESGGLALLPGLRRDDPISIKSEELEVLPQEGGRRLVFSKSVRVTQGDIRLHADRLEVVYPDGSSQPDLLQAEGHVFVSQGDRRARCDEAIYLREEQTIVCRGHAEIVQGCDRARGQEIEFDLEHERVRVTGAASVVIHPGDTEECAGVMP